MLDEPSHPGPLLERYAAKSQDRFVDNMTYCILCGLCVRYCHEVKGANVLGFIGRGEGIAACAVALLEGASD